MGLEGREGSTIVAHPLIGHQMNDVAAPDQRLGQRLGRKQMSTSSAGGENDEAVGFLSVKRHALP